MAAKQKSGKKSDNNTEIRQEDLSLLAKDIIANVGVGIYIVQHGKFVYVSDLYQKITGYTDKELIGTYSLNNIYPDDKEKVREQAIRCLKGERSGPYEYRFVTKNDEIIWVLEAVASIEYSGERAALGSFIDITERKNMEQKLQREEQLFKALTDQSSDIIVIVNREGLITYENKAIEEVLGFKANERLGCRGFDNIHPDDMSFVAREFERLFKDVNTPASRSEVRLRDINGNWTFFESVASNLSNNNVVEAVIINLRDITERKQIEQQLNHLATHDSLTGLPNRMLFMDRLQIALAQSNRNQNKLAVIMLDLDNFKDINDTLGHMVGDKLLQEVGCRLTGILRQNDTVARLGGDEFVILLSDLGKIEYAAGVAKVILKSLRKPFEFADNKITSPASIGIAVYPDDCEDIETLLKKSDMAMYAVKTQGRNNYMFYSNVIR